MSNTQMVNCLCWIKYRHYLNVTTSYFLFLLLISSFSHNTIIPTISMAEGRAISMLIEAAQSGGGYMEEESKVVRVVVGMRRGRQIGSRPPRCERRCSACGHCEAVQVPVAPLVLHKNDNRSRTRQDQNDISRSRRRNRSSSFSSKKINNFNVAYSRGDDLSNYKPMSWKCKCGDFLFNP